MAFKDILLALTSYPEPTPVSVVGEAVAFTAAVGAKISAITCEVNIQVPGSFLADAFMNIPGMIAAESKKSSANAKKLLTAFQDDAKRGGVFQDRILEKCQISEVSNVFVEHARLRDLTIVPAQEGFDQWYAESIIFGSGRPTIVMPHTRKGSGGLSWNTVVVAWDFSRPAARAVADALPILEKAKRVHVVTVKNEKVIDTRRSGADLAKHLSHHGVKINLEAVDAAGRKIGDVLKSFVTSHKGDLLVMGAYGHSRVREFILGGATRNMLSRPPVPILLSH